MAAFPHHHHVQQHQQSIPFRNFVGIDGEMPSSIAPFQYASNPPEQSLPLMVNVMDVGVDGGGVGSSGWEPRGKRVKELENNSQVSSIDFLQTRSVSTGLGLSLDDRRVGPAPAPVPAALSGESIFLPALFDGELDRELQRVDAEMDRFVRIQGERLRQAILEKVQAKQLQTLRSIEEKILQKIQQKEIEVENINKKNMELEEQMKQLSNEVGAWQQRAKYNENLIATLKVSLQQVLALGKENKEGCGDSEVDDTASFCHGRPGSLQLLSKENKDMKDLMTCKVCYVNEACMLLLPCRHLCLCKECESKLSFCPLCQSSKFIGMEVYM